MPQASKPPSCPTTRRDVVACFRTAGPRHPSRIHAVLLLGAVVGASALLPVPAAAQHPRGAVDYIVTGGKVFTADSTRPWAEAFAVRGTRIVAVGSDSAIVRLASPRTKRIPVYGRVVIPGINDAHVHVGEGEPGETFATSDVGPNGSTVPGPSFAEVRDSVRVIAARSPKGAWLQGFLGTRLLGDSSVRRDALDAVAPENPVLLRGWWGHGFLANSAALRAFGISEDAADVPGGRYVRDANGRLTGELTEYAAWGPMRRIAATRSDSVHVRALRSWTALRLSYGVTSVQDMASAWDARTTVRLLQRAALPLRVRVIRWPMSTVRGRGTDDWTGVRFPAGSRHRVAGTKYVLDGTPFEAGAFNTRPYAGRAGWYGMLNFPLDTVRAMLREALAGRGADGQVAFHVVGDSTMALLLSAMRELAPDSVWRTHRVRVEHASRLGGDKLTQAAQLGIVIAQPRSSASFRSWLSAGLVMGYGSDGQPNPFVDFTGAVTMADRPTEAITREQAAFMLTRGAAYAEWTEREKGSIAPGMLADFAVLSQDIFTVPTPRLPATRSELTVIGGRVAYGSTILAATTSSARPQ